MSPGLAQDFTTIYVLRNAIQLFGFALKEETTHRCKIFKWFFCPVLNQFAGDIYVYDGMAI